MARAFPSLPLLLKREMTLSLIELTRKDHRTGSVDNGHKKAASHPANICLGVSMLFV